MSQPTPFWSGKNATLVFLRDSKKIQFKDRTWSVKQRGVDAEDQVGGEDRARFQTIVDGYDIEIEAYMEDVEELKALILDTADRDTRTQPKDIGVGMLIKPNNGTRAAFQASQVTIGLWEFNGNPGRTERAMLRVPLRARFFDSVATV